MRKRFCATACAVTPDKCPKRGLRGNDSEDRTKPQPAFSDKPVIKPQPTFSNDQLLMSWPAGSTKPKNNRCRATRQSPNQFHAGVTVFARHEESCTMRRPAQPRTSVSVFTQQAHGLNRFEAALIVYARRRRQSSAFLVLKNPVDEGSFATPEWGLHRRLVRY